MNNKHNIKLSKREHSWIYILIIISLFLFGTEIRFGFSESLYNINIIFLFCVFLLIFYVKINLKSKNTIILSFLILYNIIINYINNSFALQPLLLLVPMVFLLFNYKKEVYEYRSMAKRTIKIYNFFIVVIFLISIIDSLFNGIIMRNVASNLTPNIISWLPDNYSFLRYRYASILGHYLVTCEAYLIFLILNDVFYIKTGEILINRVVLYIISSCGVLSTGSKTGVVLLALLIIVNLFYEKKRGVKFIIVSLILLVLCVLGSFEMVVSRFSGGSLTSGRLEMLNLAKESGLVDIRFLSGIGHDLIGEYGKYIGRFKAQIINELPFISIIIQYGLCYGLIWMFLIYIKPIIELIKKKNIYSVLCLSILFVDINTFNLILTTMDAVILYVLVVIILLWLSNVDKTNN